MTTLDQIAQAAGVTSATVSNVLSGRANARRPDAVSRAKRIRKIALDMGYRPHAAARAVRTGRTGCLGMITSANYAYSVHMPEFEVGVVAELVRRGLYLAKDHLIENDQESVNLPRLAQENIADGLLVNYAFKIPLGLETLIERHQIPAVWINCRRADNVVRPDDEQAAYHATRHLIALGHRRILLLNPNAKWLEIEHYSVDDRKAGYARAMHEAGLEPQITARQRPSERDGSEMSLRIVMKALTEGDRPTAVLSMIRGVAVLLAAARLGWRVPDDLSVISFDNGQGGDRMAPLTRLIVPFEEIGRRAVAEVCELIEQPDVRRPEVVLPMILDDGGTTAPPA